VELKPERAWRLFEKFVESCAFIHDDIITHWTHDVDEFARHALCLAPTVAVVDSVDGFGSRYSQYLDELGLWAKLIIVPRPYKASCLDALLKDTSSLATLKAQVQGKRTDISLFYSDRIEEINLLISAISTEQFRPRIWPDPSLFCRINDKATAHQFLTELGIPTASAQIVRNAEEMQSFRSAHPAGIFVKPRHHETVLMEQVDHSPVELRFPVLAEARVQAVSFSPVSCWIQHQGESAYLGTTVQLLQGTEYQGNIRDSSLIPKDVEGKLIQFCTTISDALPGHQGPAGIDAVVTEDGDVVVVDFNLRFNSSTYLLYLIHHLGLPSETVVDYREYKCDLGSMDDLGSTLSLQGDPVTGILALGPVNEGARVRQFFGVIVGPTGGEVERIRATLERRIGLGSS
jgi:hypothetical protein